MLDLEHEPSPTEKDMVWTNSWLFYRRCHHSRECVLVAEGASTNQGSPNVTLRDFML